MQREKFQKINYRGKKDHLASSLRSLLQDESGAKNAPQNTLQNKPFLQEIINYWVDYNLKLSREGTKSRARMMKYLKKLKNGKMFNGTDYHETFANHKFTVEEVKQSIDNLAKAMAPEYEPRNKAYLNVNLQDFIYKPNSTAKNKSMLIFFLQEPKKIKAEIKDDYPDITKRLVFLYKSEILGSRSAKITDEDKQVFVRASARLVAFLAEQRKNINFPFRKASDKEKADWLFESVFRSVSNLSLVTSGWFVSERTFSDRLPKYLYHQNILLKN